MLTSLCQKTIAFFWPRAKGVFAGDPRLAVVAFFGARASRGVRCVVDCARWGGIVGLEHTPIPCGLVAACRVINSQLRGLVVVLVTSFAYQGEVGVQVALNPALPLWAKSRKDEMHHALAHSLEVAAVFVALCERDATTMDRIGRALGLPSSVAVRWGALAGGGHDKGKLAPPFQARDSRRADILRDAGFVFPEGMAGAAFLHGTATTLCLPPLLVQAGWPARLSQQVADIVGGHHGIVPTAHDRQALSKRLLGTGLWERARQDHFDALRTALNLWNAPVPMVEMLAPADAVLLAGLVSVADWIASNETWFPFVDHVEDPVAYFVLASRRAEQVLSSIGWSSWRPVKRETFSQAFRWEPNSLQREVERLANELTEPTLVVIEAPPGSGKTEASEYLALKMVERCGHRGGIVTLPTQATANQMLDRIKKFLTDNSDLSRPVLQLLHGNALLSKDFNKLLKRGRKLLSGDNAKVEGVDDVVVVAAEWFTGPKRGLLAPFGVGTIDQMLLAALRTKHVFVRQMALANKVIIVDEVHAYDSYMLGLLERVIEWLAAHGSSVILMSATLPTERRARLIDAYNRGRGVQVRSQRGDPIGAVVTWATRSGSESRTFVPAYRKSIRVRWIDGRITDENGGCPLARALEQKLTNGGCVAVVCNSVSRVQKVYQVLRDRWRDGPNADIKLILFHARLPQEDRSLIEKQIRGKFGPRGDRPVRSVVVATQVIEQSLDLDFDLVVSDMAPIDLLIQRAGRAHRHQCDHRPIEEAELWVVAPDIDAQGVPKFNLQDTAIYHAHTLLRTWCALQDPAVDLGKVATAARLVEDVYASDCCAPQDPAALVAAWKETAAEMVREMDEFDAKARERRIPSPIDPEFHLADLTRAVLGEGEIEAQVYLRAETRLGAVNVPVVLAYATPNGPALDPEGKELVFASRTPTRKRTKRLLNRSVPIGHRRLAWALLKMKPPSGWENHPLLKHHRLIVLRKNPAGKWIRRIGARTLVYDTELGVVID